MRERLETIRSAILGDRAANAPKTLAEYATLFPGEDGLVARAYLEAGPDVDGPRPAGRDQDSIAHYRLLGELGRGGQGAVHLALDTRLHRKVALKVLTQIVPGSDSAIDRFRREAEVASKLNHPGICGILDAGVAGGIPWLAMPVVEGTTLAQRISAAKRETEGGEPSSVLQLSGTTKQEGPADGGADATARPAAAALPDVEAHLRLFAKAARALHAAHEAGVIHRDIKPGNIMVTPRDEAVILDFGLARAEEMELPTLTRTGDLFGTPAYMSPEQISGHRIRLDRRSDVWSLGVTLYECLTLRRPFDAPTREGVYQAIMTKDAPDSRRLHRGIPRDLRVVLETALEKDRDRRYATAEALAEDLDAVREGRPIQARPVGPAGRLLRWARREPAKASLLALLLVTLPLIAALVTIHLKNREGVEAARRAALEQEKERLLARAHMANGDPSRYRELIDIYDRVLALEGGSPEAVFGKVQTHLLLKDLESARRTLARHENAFSGRLPIDILNANVLGASGKTEEAAKVLAGLPKPRTALDHYLLAAFALQQGEAEVQAARSGRAEFTRMLRHARRAVLLSPAPRYSDVMLCAHAAGRLKDREAAVEFATVLRARWPGDPDAHFGAGFALSETGDPTDLDAAIAAYREGHRRDPDRYWYWSHASLASCLYRKGLHDEAIAAARESIRLNPGHAEAHSTLGDALCAQGCLDESIAAFREALRLKPGLHWTNTNLGNVLHDKGRFDEAIALHRESIRIKPDYSFAHYNLGKGLLSKGLLDEALASFHEALRHRPDDGMAHNCIGVIHRDRGLVDEAMTHFRTAIRLRPDLGEAYNNLGVALMDRGKFEEAVYFCREAVRLMPQAPGHRVSLGAALASDRKFEAALEEVEAALRLQPENAAAHALMGLVLRDLGRPREALESFRRAQDHGLKPTDPVFPNVEAALPGVERESHEEADRKERVARHLADGTEPATAPELAELALAASISGRPDVAARWYRKAFAADPALAGNLDRQHRFRAACAAVQAARSAADAVSAAAWRKEARAWLAQDLDAWESRLRSERVQPERVKYVLENWERIPDLADVRGEALDSLPESERQDFRALWGRVRELQSGM